MNTTSSQLQIIRKKMNGCRLCLEAGYEIYPRPIYSGEIGAQVMIIGQAPGITEQQAGRPFNAGSGTRLFQWLTDAGFEEALFREKQYITSVTKCYPGRAASGSGDRLPSRGEQEYCAQYLLAEIELVNPQLIIPVGRLAITRFYSKKAKLSDVIGSQQEINGRWFIPLPHPSGASRWHQSAENRTRIQQAIELIGKHRQRLKL